MVEYKVINADIIDWCKEYDGDKFHAVLTDPPYHLTSGDGANGGFMGKKWDGGGIAFDPQTWGLIAKHLHPGAFGMSFSGSRTWHRLAVGIEDAGIIIHPTIFGWSYGSGFPKATRIDTQIQSKSEHVIVGKKVNTYDGANRNPDKHKSPSELSRIGKWGLNDTPHGKDEFEPTDPIAKRWVGHRYGLQALKPAVEPIIVWQKPYKNKPLDDIVNTGAGAFNIDDGRIFMSKGDFDKHKNNWKPDSDYKSNETLYEYGSEKLSTHQNESGRWPSNFILMDEGAVEQLDRQSGHLRSGFLKKGHPYGLGNGQTVYSKLTGETQIDTYGDEGGASRFFYQVNRELDLADPILYTGKASTTEREAGLLDFKVKGGCATNQNWICRKCNKLQLEGHGNICKCDNPLWIKSKVKNHHPTVKPIDLSRYLATLLLPPSEYKPRRLLVPFAGVGSEMIGAIKSGWDEVIGVEFEAEYCEIAEARLDFWANHNMDDAREEMKQRHQLEEYKDNNKTIMEFLD